MPNKSFRFLFAKYWFLSNFRFGDKLHGKQRAFTLIELLITITILAVVSTIGLASYRNAQIVARDGRRKEDLKAIASALEVFHLQNGRYPCMKGGPTGDPGSPSTSEPGQQNSNPSYPAAAYNINGVQPFWLKDTGCQDVLPPDPIAVADMKPFNQNMISAMPTDPLLDSDRAHPSSLGPYMNNHVPESFGYTYLAPFCDSTGTRGNCEYVVPGTKPGASYVLWAKLENVNDPEACQNKQYRTCTGVDACAGLNHDGHIYMIQVCPP